jgi:hypothetical protein
LPLQRAHPIKQRVQRLRPRTFNPKPFAHLKNGAPPIGHQLQPFLGSQKPRPDIVQLNQHTIGRFTILQLPWFFDDVMDNPHRRHIARPRKIMVMAQKIVVFADKAHVIGQNFVQRALIAAILRVDGVDLSKNLAA